MTQRIIYAAVFALVAGTAGAAEDPSPASAREAVERSLGFLEKEGVAWIKEKQCVSCHHVPFLLWSFNEAQARGLAIDSNKAAEWTDWSWKFSRTRREWFKLTSESLKPNAMDGLPAATLNKLTPMAGKPFAAEKDLLAELGRLLPADELGPNRAALVKRAARPLDPMNDGGGLDTMTQMLLGRAIRTKEAKAAASEAELAEVMTRWQQPDGSWKASGQLPSQNRPRPESDAVTTQWTVLALATIQDPTPATRDSMRRGLEFLKTVKPGASTESLIGALMVESRFGRPEQAKGLLEQLRSRENPDGGWSWRAGSAGDAFTTGQALYALRRIGVEADDPAVRAGRNALIRTQTPDGSWPDAAATISTAKTAERLKKVVPIYRYWGSAWAVIGLTQTLP